MVSTGARTFLRISAVMLYICSQLAGGSALASWPCSPLMRLAGCRLTFLGKVVLRFAAEAFGERTSVLTVRLRLRFEGGGVTDKSERGDDGAAFEASDDRSELSSS